MTSLCYCPFYFVHELGASNSATSSQRLWPTVAIHVIAIHFIHKTVIEKFFSNNYTSQNDNNT